MTIFITILIALLVFELIDIGQKLARDKTENTAKIVGGILLILVAVAIAIIYLIFYLYFKP